MPLRYYQSYWVWPISYHLFSSKLVRLANTIQLESPLSCCLQNPPLKRHWLQEVKVEVRGLAYPILVLELLGSTRPGLAIARRTFHDDWVTSYDPLFHLEPFPAQPGKVPRKTSRRNGKFALGMGMPLQLTSRHGNQMKDLSCALPTMNQESRLIECNRL